MPGKPNLLIAVGVVCIFCSTAFAQNTVTRPNLEEYHPGWGVIPEVKRPAFDYREAHNTKLIAEAGENLNYLSVDYFTIGRTIGPNRAQGAFQVIAPNGQVTFVDNIQAPKCGLQIVAQQTNTQQPGGGYQLQPSPSSEVTIGEIDFSTCY